MYRYRAAIVVILLCVVLPAPRRVQAAPHTLTVSDVGVLCSAHRGRSYEVSLTGYAIFMPLHGPAGGIVGRLYPQPNPHAFYAGDTTPFVQLWLIKLGNIAIVRARVQVHGILHCDLGSDLVGWQGSLTVDHLANLDARISIGTTAHGVKLTLHMPSSSYPRNALAPVHLTLRNTSTKPVYILNFCQQENLSAQVMNGNGTVLYPPAMDFPPITNPGCKRVPSEPLGSGESMDVRTYVILRGSWVRATVRIANARVGGRTSEIDGKPVRVYLTPADPPAYTLVLGSSPYVAFTSPAGTNGTLVYQYWLSCADLEPHPIPCERSDAWVQATDSRIAIPATSFAGFRVAGWHAIAAFVGGPVVAVSYTAPPPGSAR